MTRILRHIDAISLSIVWVICTAVLFKNGAYTLWFVALLPETIVIFLLARPKKAAEQTTDASDAGPEAPPGTGDTDDG